MAAFIRRLLRRPREKPRVVETPPIPAPAEPFIAPAPPPPSPPIILDPARRYPAEMTAVQRRRVLAEGLPAFPEQTPVRYTIYKDGNEYFAVNGNTGKIDYGGSVFDVVAQNALDVGGPNPGIAHFKKATYIVNSGLVAKNGNFIRGEGRGTIFQLKAGFNENVDIIGYQSGSDNVVLQDFAIDGNRANQTSGMTTTGVNIQGVTGWRLRNLYLSNLGKSATGKTGIGVYINNAGDILVENCSFANNDYENIYLTTPHSGVVIKNNYVAALSGARAIRINNNASRSVVEGNYVSFPAAALGGAGIYLEENVRDLQLVNNQLFEGEYGIYFNVDSGYTALNCLIDGNIVIGALENGITVKRANRCTVVNNIVEDIGMVGIHLNRASQTKVALNTVRAASQTTDNSGSAIVVEAVSGSQSLKNIVTLNHVIHGSGTKRQKYGILLVNGDVVETNVLFNDVTEGGKTLNIYNSGTRTVVRGNLGYVTEFRGVATVLSGGTSVTVNLSGKIVNVSGSPTGVVVAPITGLASAAKYYVDSLSSGSFAINTNADPNQDVKFSYEAFYDP